MVNMRVSFPRLTMKTFQKTHVVVFKTLSSVVFLIMLLSQRVHIQYYYGIRSQKTIPIMGFGDLVPYWWCIFGPSGL